MDDTISTGALRVLVIDDEPGIVDFIHLGLTYEGFQVLVAADGNDGLAQAQRTQPHLIILDLMLPGIDGLEVCRRLRHAGLNVPIIMLTAKDAVADRVMGLNEGADDYLTKPFKFEELLARVRAVLRRSPALSGTPLPGSDLRFETIRLDPLRHTVFRGERELHLTAREFDLLTFFMRHPSHVLTRDAILNGVWGYDFYGDSNVIEVYVRYLRQKLADPNVIQTVRGIGYVLKETDSDK